MIPVKVMKGEEILSNKLAQRHHIPAKHHVSPSCHTLDNCESQLQQATELQVNVGMPFPSENFNRKIEKSHILKSNPSEGTFYWPCYLFTMRDFEQKMCVNEWSTWLLLSYASSKTELISSNQISHSSPIKRAPTFIKSGWVGLTSACQQAPSMTPQIHHGLVKREAFALMPPLLQPCLKSESISKIRHIQMMKRSLVICQSHLLWAAKEISTSRENSVLILLTLWGGV